MEMQKKCKIYICFLIDFICPDSTLLILVPFFQSANVTPHFQCGVIRENLRVFIAITQALEEITFM